MSMSWCQECLAARLRADRVRLLCEAIAAHERGRNAMRGGCAACGDSKSRGKCWCDYAESDRG